MEGVPMSTPITHNEIFCSAALEAAKRLTQGNLDEAKSLAYKIIQAGIGYYNYPDAVQAVHREDGTPLSRRVSHFELAKTFGEESNSHEILTPQFLKVVNEEMVLDTDAYHDAADQIGDIMGQYTDWFAWRQAKQEYLVKVDGDVNSMLLVELAELHIMLPDWFNDQLFRKFVRPLSDGGIQIGRCKFLPEAKQAAFKTFKSVLMKLQEGVSARVLEFTFEELDDSELAELNAAIEFSYREAYSPWLSANTLGYVKPITLEWPTISEEELDFLEMIGVGVERLTSESTAFVTEVVELTYERLLGLVEFMEILD